MSYQIVLFSALAFVLAASSDWLELAHLRAVGSGRAGGAAIASVGMWAVGTVGLLLCLTISWWILPAEALGLVVGTYLGMRRAQRVT